MCGSRSPRLTTMIEILSSPRAFSWFIISIAFAISETLVVSLLCCLLVFCVPPFHLVYCTVQCIPFPSGYNIRSTCVRRGVRYCLYQREMDQVYVSCDNLWHWYMTDCILKLCKFYVGKFVRYKTETDTRIRPECVVSQRHVCKGGGGAWIGKVDVCGIGRSQRFSHISAFRQRLGVL